MENLGYDDYQMEDQIPYEIIEGVKTFMVPSPTYEHGSIVSNLVTIFNSYFWSNSVGRVFGDNIDVHLPDGNLVMPDLTVICDLNVLKRQGTIYGVPDLVVEVLSRSTMKNDIGIKKSIYERNGIKEYWIIDQWSKRIEVYHLIDGKYEVDDVYQVYSPFELEELTDEERTYIKTEIKVSIFDDLLVSIDKVFMWVD